MYTKASLSARKHTSSQSQTTAHEQIPKCHRKKETRTQI
jgi:hypothetical protein